MSKSLCCYAFEALNHLLTGSHEIPLEKFEKVAHSTASFPDTCPLFVTWNKHGNLRGCIGTFLDLQLAPGVKRFSITSALHDSRFPPVKKLELSSLLVSVTLLANFTPISDCLDWKVGLHGLKVSFDYNGTHYSGTFLPSVAEDENWDQLTTLYYLLKKSDLESVHKSKVLEFYTDGLQQKWLWLTRYEGVKAALDYDEYVDIREKAEAQ